MVERTERHRLERLEHLGSRVPVYLNTGTIIGAGLAGAAVFAVMMMIAASTAGDSAWKPWQLFASVATGRSALQATGVQTLFTGLVVHVLLSLFFAFMWAAVVRRLPLDVRESWGTHSAAAMIYGLVIWLVNYQLIARFAFPWFLDRTNGFVQAMIHAFGFGLPLAVVMLGRYRRVAQPARAGEPPGPTGDEVPI